MRVRSRALFPRAITCGLNMAIIRAYVLVGHKSSLLLQTRKSRSNTINIWTSNAEAMVSQFPRQESHAVSEKASPSFTFNVIAGSVAISPALRRCTSGASTQLDLPLCHCTLRTLHSPKPMEKKGVEFAGVVIAVSAVNSHNCCFTPWVVNIHGQSIIPMDMTDGHRHSLINRAVTPILWAFFG